MFKELDWIEPVILAHQISTNPDYQENWLLLYSGLNQEISNSKSYLCLYPKKQLILNRFDEFEENFKNSNQRWFGYFSYDLQELNKNEECSKSLIDLPKMWMVNFNLVFEFDHQKQKLLSNYSTIKYLKNITQNLNPNHQIPSKITRFKTEKLSSNFSKIEYFKKAQTIKNMIAKGEVYQANLTRKFFGKFSKKPQNYFELFLKLNKKSPANYSAFLKLNENYVISSSPELFLKIDENGQVVSVPIKGTAARSSNSKLDKLLKENLQNSGKEKAENLMIVDLVRNDLAKNCLPNSVKVKNLFKISSYKTLHHMSSEIHGAKDLRFSNLDLIRSCFPPGSMTGAPKIKAVTICQKLERNCRGVYSGAIGFIDQKQCHLSVVIRTLLIQNNKFEFQVGGAITFDSKPNNELQESINKAKAIARVLGIKIINLKNL